MPGYIVLPLRREPYFGFPFTGWQWPIPVDENRTRILEATITYPRNFLSRFGYRLWWNLYYKWVHRWAFTYQDERQIGAQNYRSPETFCSTDVGVTFWRRLARQIARPACNQARPGNGHDQREERESI